MLNKLRLELKNYFQQLREMDPVDFNQFIFNNLIMHLFKTENILPFIISICIIGFSILVEGSRFLFIPQTSVAAYASFFIFTLVVSLITILIYPAIIIFSINFIASYFKGATTSKLLLKLLALTLSFIAGAAIFTSKAVAFGVKIQIVFIWLGLYFILAGLYLTHRKHNTVTKLTKIKIIFMVIIGLTMARPLVLIFIHTSEAVNFTNINPQVYLSAENCALLKNLDGQNVIEAGNSIFNNAKYFQALPNNHGCYIYGNTIRYSFAYDYVLLIKKNIQPIIGRTGTKYNEYVRLSCYAGNCYSETHFFFRNSEDIYAELIAHGQRIDKPL